MATEVKQPPPDAEELKFVDGVASSVVAMVLSRDYTADHTTVAQNAFKVAFAMLDVRRILLSQYAPPPA